MNEPTYFKKFAHWWKPCNLRSRDSSPSQRPCDSQFLKTPQSPSGVGGGGGWGVTETEVGAELPLCSFKKVETPLTSIQNPDVGVMPGRECINTTLRSCSYTEVSKLEVETYSEMMWPHVFPLGQPDPSRGQEAQEFGGTAGPSGTAEKLLSLTRSCPPTGQRRVGTPVRLRWSDSSVLVFHPPVPSPWVSPAALSRPSLMPKKQEGTRRSGRECRFSHKLSRRLSPSP